MSAGPLMGRPRLRVATYPEEYNDAADLFARAAAADELWEKMIREAKPVVTWLIDRLEDKHDLSTADGAEDACEDIVDVLLRQHPVSRHRYADHLAKKLGVPVDAVWEMLQDAIGARAAYWEEHPRERPELPPRQRRRFPGLHRLDKYGETERFDCPRCDSEESAKASKPIDLWRCVVCEASGKASELETSRGSREEVSVWNLDAI